MMTSTRGTRIKSPELLGSPEMDAILERGPDPSLHRWPSKRMQVHAGSDPLLP